MTYKTTKAIRDTQDSDFCYYAGEIYPRDGYEPTDKRIEELLKKGAIISDGAEAEKPKKATKKPKAAKE